ncbi:MULTISPECIES: ATP-binding cassette domain-containing protein [Methanobacterium]|uniref:ATP-binding cassette domain-containing protein n=1 Tax=Methanobacterium veterum TaxID=408577 RepID=A0A9E5A6C4_9EURY|nr:MULTISPECIES: ATP-binding cassette domain-containing protein [Methanobacterium]MCZ3366957.1 ATP-binding cassette domain-containing protein [Methanobacterium veterum]MCZ3373896.1 ATP-binding cassette domain-containing protein [Methanobacterium veterum]
MNNDILKFQEVWKTYGADKTKITALKGINLELKKNSLNLILGPSGSGKTTLLNLSSLLDTPTSGKIILNGQDTSQLSKSERSKIRRNKIGTVYQRANLFPYLNLLENTMLPMISKDMTNASKVLNNVGIVEISKFPDEISIEKQQRVALARSMINDPNLIIADEPTGELDKESTEAVMDLIMQIKSKHTILMLSNNLNLTEYCDELFLIKDGHLQKSKN